MSLQALKRFYASRSEGVPATQPAPSSFTEPTLVVKNSFCELHAIPAEALEVIRDALTYKNEQVAQEKIRTFRLIAMAKARGQIRLLYKLKKHLEELDDQEIVCWLRGNQVPTGHLQIIRGLLRDNGVEFNEQDLRRLPTPSHTFRWLTPPLPLRYYQKEMVDLALQNSRGVFEAAVGSGKTRVLSEIIKELEVTSLIIVPSTALLEQIYRGAESAFGRKCVGVITTAKVRKQSQFPPIRIVTIQTLAALQKRGLLKRLIRDVDLLAVDEIHHAGSKSYTDLLPMLDHVYYRFGFTGTFLRNDSKTLDMWGFLSNKLYEYPAWKATEEGFLTPVRFIIHPLTGKRCNQYQREYAKNYCGSHEILGSIQRIVEQTPTDEQILILVDRKDSAGLLIHEMLEHVGFENTYISGDDDKKAIADSIEAFNAKEIRILVGSTILGEGVDIHATNRLILARGGKSEIAIVQAIGRAIRPSEGKSKAFVHDFRFEGTKFLEKHLIQRLEIYRNSFGGEIEEV